MPVLTGVKHYSLFSRKLYDDGSFMDHYKPHVAVTLHRHNKSCTEEEAHEMIFTYFNDVFLYSNAGAWNIATRVMNRVREKYS